MIPSARMLAEKYCDHHIIENVPRAPLDEPTVLNGRMFGMPIEYKRAFETSFEVPQPPRLKRLLTTDGPSDKAETSSFYFSERSKEWWAAVKITHQDRIRRATLRRTRFPRRSSTTWSGYG